MGRGSPARTSDNTAGAIFAAQPQVRETPIKVFFCPKGNIMFDLLLPNPVSTIPLS